MIERDGIRFHPTTAGREAGDLVVSPHGFPRILGRLSTPDIGARRSVCYVFDLTLHRGSPQ